MVRRDAGSWGARRDVVNRAEYATWQAFEILTEHELVDSNGGRSCTVEVETIFNEFSFTVILYYRGLSVPLALSPPTHEELIANELACLQMAGYMLRRLADDVRIRSSGENCEMQLTFND